MASTSSSSIYVPAFEVYISFRGANEFISVLYKSLFEARLKPFIDFDEKQEVQEVTPQIQRYITEARASIIVLSEDFANSSYCLDELCLILEQKRNPSNLVLPVFYGVDPSDVRKQVGNFKIKAKEGSRSKWTADNVNRWKAALTEAAGLAGWVVSGHEIPEIFKIVEDIARKIFSRYSQLGLNLPNPRPPLDFNASSSTSVPTFDVFISFIAKHAHPDFIDDLFGVLTMVGIDPIIDFEAKQERQELTPEIQTYIKETRASIIVLSKDFANSSCCLDELCLILELKRNRSNLVFPVFYGVNPSDVTKQLENLMIEADEGSSSKWTADNVNRWKAAVTEAANLLGWFVSEPETTPLMFEIVDDIAWTIFLRLGLDLHDPSRPFDHMARKGRFIGKLFVSSEKIAMGSKGTVVFKGAYDGRIVAVKRLVKTHYDVSREIKSLHAADQHPNIVRWYDTARDRDFIYLSLEPCDCSLYDLIQNQMGYLESFRLMKPNGYPSCILLKLMREICAGLVHLHKLDIIHRDLKPHNVLIVRGERPCVKLADMGISKFIVGDAFSLGSHASGTPGWRPREQILQGERQTQAMDMFSLGCVLFFCMTGGKHPFGDKYFELDGNVINNNIVNLSLVKDIPEAWDLCSRLLNREPKLRPKASEVLLHPLFWKSEKRVSFLRDASDRLEPERWTGSIVLASLENEGSVAFRGRWDVEMDPVFINEMTKKRKYRYNKVEDLLRIMRNTINHYGTLPPNIQELLGDFPEGVDDYFRSKFPNLLMVVYKVISEHCKEDQRFRNYY